MKANLLSLLFVFACFQCFATDKPAYAVENISPAVRLTESAVVRNKSTNIDLTRNSARITTFQATTLLNDKLFEDYEHIVVMYDDNSKITDFEATIYDKNGNEIEKYKWRDTNDVSVHDGYSIYDDNRYVYIRVDEFSYPFTIEYSHTKKTKETYLLPSQWYLSEHSKSYIEHTEINIDKSSDIDYSFEYYLKGHDLSEKEITDEKIHFAAENVESFPIEDFAPRAREQAPYVLLSLHQFELDNYKGSYENWQTLGDFYYRLNKGRDEVSEELVQQLKAKMAPNLSTREKVKAIYEHLQNKTRYVSVQLGVGGWQTFPAEYVEENSYGDCKALTNYTYSLLKEFDINSYPVLIHAERDYDNARELKENLAFNAFNHVILAVPEPEDTIWLECTSQTQPFDFLGAFTMDRKALMVKPNGKSELVETPSTTPSNDVSNLAATVQLKKDGSALMEFTLVEHNTEAEHLHDLYLRESKEEFKKTLPLYLNVPNSRVQEFDVSVKEEGKAVEVHATLTAKNAANVNGPRIFLSPLQYAWSYSTPEHTDNRKFDILLPTAFSRNAIYTYELPENYTIENMQKENLDLTTDFGRYSMEVDTTDHSLIYKTSYTQSKGVYPAEQIDEFYNFRKSINDSFSQIAVLVEE